MRESPTGSKLPSAASHGACTLKVLGVVVDRGDVAPNRLAQRLTVHVRRASSKAMKMDGTLLLIVAVAVRRLARRLELGSVGGVPPERPCWKTWDL